MQDIDPSAQLRGAEVGIRLGHLHTVDPAGDPFSDLALREATGPIPLMSGSSMTNQSGARPESSALTLSITAVAVCRAAETALQSHSFSELSSTEKSFPERTTFRSTPARLKLAKVLF